MTAATRDVSDDTRSEPDEDTRAAVGRTAEAVLARSLTLAVAESLTDLNSTCAGACHRRPGPEPVGLTSRFVMGHDRAFGRPPIVSKDRHVDTDELARRRPDP